MQLELDLWEPAPESVKELRCWFCGEVSGNAFVYALNHPPMGAVCGKAWMFLNHCRAIVKHFSDDPRFKDSQRNCYAEGCATHYQGEWSRNPIPECAALEYDEKRAWLLSAGVPDEDIPVLPSAARIEGEKK